MTNQTIHRIVLACVVALVASSEVSAQVIKAPPRQARPLFRGQPPNSTRPTNELTLEANLLGGYDQNLNPLVSGTAPVTGSSLATPAPSGYLGVADAGLTYDRSSARRAFGASGRAYMNTYRNVGLEPAYGGEVSINGSTNLGRRSSIQLSQGAQDAPYFSLGLLGPLGGVGGNPTAAFTNGRSWTIDSRASLDHDWTRNTRTTVGYVYSRRGYSGISINRVTIGQVGPFNNDSHAASLELQRRLGRPLNTRAQYRHRVSSSVQAGGGFRPITHDEIDAGFDYSRDLSRTRHLGLSAGGGGAYVQASAFLTGAPYEYWAPLAHGTLTYDFGRSWSASADYRRAVQVLQALNATQQEFVAHSATLALGGMMSSRIELAISAAYSNGQTGTVAVLAGTNANKYEAYTGTAQLQFMLTTWWSAMLNVSHVENKLNAAASQALGVVPQLQRSSVRVGLAWRFPLIGQRRAPGQPGV